MASISVPCPKCSVINAQSLRSRNLKQQLQMTSLSSSKPSFLAGSGLVARFQGPNRIHLPILKAQLHEASKEDSSNSSTLPSTNSEVSSSDGKDPKDADTAVQQSELSGSVISTLIAEVSDIVHERILNPIFHAEASKEGSSDSSPLSSTQSEISSSDIKDPKVADTAVQQSVHSESAISDLMAEVSDIVKLVDSRDIMELKLKQMDCELIIRKRGAFAQPAPTSHAVMMQPSPQPTLPLQPQMAHSTPAASAPSSPAPPLPSPSKGRKSSLPPLKCPMAGTFYRCPAPGEPSFVKVGDKVQKGQVVCIIEAMKLMNEIEADRSGTVVEILAEDGKPVSVDTPLLIIQP